MPPGSTAYGGLKIVANEPGLKEVRVARREAPHFPKGRCALATGCAHLGAPPPRVSEGKEGTTAFPGPQRTRAMTRARSYPSPKMGRHQNFCDRFATPLEHLIHSRGCACLRRDLAIPFHDTEGIPGKGRNPLPDIKVLPSYGRSYWEPSQSRRESSGRHGQG
jgi:hypothetical protein